MYKVTELLQVIRTVFSDLTEIAHSLIYLSSLESSGPSTVKKSLLFTSHPSVLGSTQVERMVCPESSIDPIVKPTRYKKEERCQENYFLKICV